MKLIQKISKSKLGAYSIPGFKKQKIDPNLNESYIFDNLVKGAFNNMAINAGQLIASDPGNNPYNPFLIFGPVGVGKTHIVQAIGHETLKNHRDKNVFYINFDDFYSQYLQYCKANNHYDFINFYQGIDLLIIDDIDGLFKASEIWDTFFHLFNHLHQNHKQVIFTSSIEPCEFTGIDIKILSRLKCGLSTEIKIPDIHKRTEILRSKSHLMGIIIPDDCLEYIAKNVTSNIREMEGALISVIAFSTLNKQDINIELTIRVIDKQYKKPKKEICIEYIEKVVCNYFHIHIEDLDLKTRKRDIVVPRQIAMFFSKNLTKFSLATIGLKIGGKSHATVLHACNTVNNLYDTDKKFRYQIEEIEKKLKEE